VSDGTAGSRSRRADLPRLPRRAADSHKGDYGRVLIIAGSLRMPGAALLAASAALRGGAGLVTLAAPEAVAARIAGHVPGAMHLPLPMTKHGGLVDDAASRDALAAAIENADVVAVGPGLGTEDATVRLVQNLAASIAKPLVLDADGLNGVARGDARRLLGARRGPTVLTPHPGEFARLEGASGLAHSEALGGATPMLENDRAMRAERLAAALSLVVVLKSHRSVVTDGARTYFNDTGNPGMATGGSGDVLTGLIAALLAVLDEPLDAAILGVHLHGLAGDLALEGGSEEGLIASDLLATLPRAFARLRGA
jgi:ADP-dependent NAD(P)H-hydrate dehydratase